MSKQEIELLLFAFAILAALANIFKILEYLGVKIMPLGKSPIADSSASAARTRTQVAGDLKFDKIKLRTPMLFGLVSLMLSSVGLFVAASSPSPTITPDNIEEHVGKWLDNFHASVQNQPGDEVYFRKIATLFNGHKAAILRPKGDRDKYLVIQTVMKPIEGEQNLWDKLSDSQTADLFKQIAIEAARSRNSFSLSSKPIALTMEKRIPITNALTESVLMGSIEELDSVTIALQQIITATLRAYKITP